MILQYLKNFNHNNNKKTVKKTLYINEPSWLYIVNFCNKNDISISNLINILIIDFIYKIKKEKQYKKIGV